MKHETSFGTAFKAGIGVGIGLIVAPILFAIGAFAIFAVICAIGMIGPRAIQPRPEPAVQRPQEAPGIPPGFVRYKDGRILRKEIADGLDGPHIAIPEEVARRANAEKIDAALRDNRGP